MGKHYKERLIPGVKRCAKCHVIKINNSKFKADMETWYRKQSFFTEERFR